MNGGTWRMRRSLVRATAALLAGTVWLGLTACTPAPSGPGVAVLFPGGPDDAWGASAEVLRAELEREGHAVEVRFSGDDIPTQLGQLQEAYAAAPAAIVVAPVDVTALAAEFAVHDDPGVTVISYGRLVLDAPEVDVFASFDHREVGRQQARALLAGLGLSDAVSAARAGHPVELLAGSSDDPAAHAAHEGVLDVLTSYLDTGAIVVPSGRVTFAQAAILRGAADIAAERVTELLAAGVQLAGVLAPSDAMSTSVADAIVAHGWGVALPPDAAPPTPAPSSTSTPAADPGATATSAPQSGEPAPPEPDAPPAVVLVGGGATLAGVRAVAEGTRTATAYRDPSRLARAVANMVREILRGSPPTVTRGVLSDNGAAELPTRLVVPLLVTTQRDARALVP